LSWRSGMNRLRSEVAFGSMPLRMEHSGDVSADGVPNHIDDQRYISNCDKRKTAYDRGVSIPGVRSSRGGTPIRRIFYIAEFYHSQPIHTG